MNKFLQYTLTGLLLLAPAALAVQLSDLSPSLNRQEADDNLTKDYAYRVMSDLSVRRIWNLDDNRKLTIDFEGKTGNLICIVVDYRKPVSMDEADKDAADIGKFEEANWRKFSSDKAAKYYMDRARAMKFEEGYMFEELSGSNKCIRLTFYPKVPKENRRLISEGSTTNGTSAMGSTLSGSAVKKLLEDEERRLYTPNKTDKADSPKPARKKAESVAKEDSVTKEEPVVATEPGAEVEEEINETPKETGKVVKTPIKVDPIKTIMQKGDRDGDVNNLIAKMGLDKLETMHWIIGGVGLVILITLISAIGRSNERRKLKKRAERLRNSTATVQASLRHSVRKSNAAADKSKLKLK